jgi:integrase
LNTGLRDQELCGLQWSWEHRVPELDSPGIQPTVFVLPSVKSKDKQTRVVVLNDRAQAIVENMRGQHPVYVFTWVNDVGVRDRIGRIRKHGLGQREAAGGGQVLMWSEFDQLSCRKAIRQIARISIQLPHHVQLPVMRRLKKVQLDRSGTLKGHAITDYRSR